MEPASADPGAPGGDRSSLEAQLAEALTERTRLWEELHRCRAQQREVEYYEREMQRMATSLSWRITTPLRAGKTLLVRLRRRLDQPPS